MTTTNANEITVILDEKTALEMQQALESGDQAKFEEIKTNAVKQAVESVIEKDKSVPKTNRVKEATKLVYDASVDAAKKVKPMVQKATGVTAEYTGKGMQGTGKGLIKAGEALISTGVKVERWGVLVQAGVNKKFTAEELEAFKASRPDLFPSKA